MRPTDLLRTSAFRLTLIHLLALVVSVAAVFAFVYWSTAGVIARQTDQTVAAEVTGLGEHYRRFGLGALRAVVRERSAHQRRSLYLLAAPRGRILAGNLDKPPDFAPGAAGWLDFSYARPVAGGIRTHAARGRLLRLPGGFLLLVGRDIQDRAEIGDRVRGIAIWAVVLTVLLGLAGGLIISRNVLRRIEAIDRTGREIMAGDLSRRVPVSPRGDELDNLAGNLNDMLARIEGLMTGLREVTDNIAHDLRTPVTRLRGRLEAVLRGPDDVAAYRAALEETLVEADAVLATFNGLLEIARAEAGGDTAAFGEVDLAAVARDVAELYEPLAEEKGIAFSVDLDAPAKVRGVPELLAQALANLVDNAVKYTAAGGSIRVGLQGGRITVSDNGPGIPEADRERVFERFMRLERSRGLPGNGLGLALVAAVARRHKAELTLADNRPGLKVEFALAVEDGPVR